MQSSLVTFNISGELQIFSPTCNFFPATTLKDPISNQRIRYGFRVVSRVVSCRHGYGCRNSRVEVTEDMVGFGYDRGSDDYKIVKTEESPHRVLMVYSLRLNAWKRIKNVLFKNMRLITLTASSSCGALHWLEGTRENNQPPSIVGFDLALEKFNKVPFPTVKGDAYISSGGPLYVFDSYDSGVDVWMIKDFGAENPWYKAFSYDSVNWNSRVSWDSQLISPVSFSKSGKEVLLHLNRGLLWYDHDPERKVGKDVQIHGIATLYGVRTYKESFSAPEAIKRQ